MLFYSDYIIPTHRSFSNCVRIIYKYLHKYLFQTQSPLPPTSSILRLSLDLVVNQDKVECIKGEIYIVIFTDELHFHSYRRAG